MFECDSTPGPTLRESPRSDVDRPCEELAEAPAPTQRADRTVSYVRLIRGWFPRSAAVLTEVVVAFLLRELIAHRHPGFAPFITFYPAVLLASLLDGALAGIAVTALAAVIADIWIFPPVGHFAVADGYDLLSLGIFFAFGTSLSMVVELYHRNRETLAALLVDEAVSRERKQLEAERMMAESLRAERQRLLDVMESLPAMVSLRRPDHQIAFANRSFREKFGDPAGRRCYDLRFGRAEPCEDCDTFQPLETGEPSHREVMFPDSSLIEAHDFPFKDLDGASLILEMGLDITARRRAEVELQRHREHLEELVAERTRQVEAVNRQLAKEVRELEQAQQKIRESGATLEAALASMADSVIIVDADGRFVQINDAFATFYRFKSKVECPRDFAGFVRNIEVFTPAGQPLSLEMFPMHRALRGETAANVELSYRRRDTGETWIGSVSFGPVRAVDGTITGAVLTAHDITNRKRSEAELAEARLQAESTAAQLRTIFDSVEERLYVCDGDGHTIMANGGPREEYGDGPNVPSVAEMVDFLEVYDLDDRPIPFGEWPISRALRGERIHSLEIRVRFKTTGEERIFSCNGSAIRDGSGKILMVIFTSADITERKRAEQAIRETEKITLQREQFQALAERLRLAREEERTRVSRDLHDQIGQILTAIKLDLTWMRRHLARPGEEVRERLEGTVALINEGVRSVRKICSGLRPGVLDDLGLAAAIEWQANEFASRTGIECIMSVPSADIAVEGKHSTEFFRIFQECLTNVIRHAEAKTVRVALIEDQGDLVLSVADDGKGFRESEVPEALGFLGMKERAQVCGGSLEIVSSPGAGTTITLRVPAHTPLRIDADYAHSDHR
jgi:signal transduction histidine kinase